MTDAAPSDDRTAEAVSIAQQLDAHLQLVREASGRATNACAVEALIEIAEQARKVRNLQQLYFATRDRDTLGRCRCAEKVLDDLLAECTLKQTRLF